MDDFAKSRLRPLGIGLILALLAIGFGWGLGGVFGAAEASVKAVLADSGAEALQSAYDGDTARMKRVVHKSWSYMKRSHLHGGVLGSSAVALILLLALLSPPKRGAQVASAALGAGSLGYGVYWMFAGFKAPGLGSTHLAKESLDWLAIPSAGALLVGLGITGFLAIKAMYGKP